MCWIIIWYKKQFLINKLQEQKDRWLDSLWVIDVDNNAIHQAIKNDISWYNVFINKNIKNKWLKILHHRKASVGAVNMNNAHPFRAGKIVLLQNGTIRNFHKDYKDIYKKDVDTANLTEYLSAYYEIWWLRLIASELESLSMEYKEDNFGIIVILDKEEILIFSDGTRELNVKTNNNNKIREISNYKKRWNEWDSYFWHMILSYSWDIVEDELVLIETAKDKNERIKKEKEEEEKKKKEKEISINYTFSEDCEDYFAYAPIYNSIYEQKKHFFSTYQVINEDDYEKIYWTKFNNTIFTQTYYLYNN